MTSTDSTTTTDNLDFSNHSLTDVADLMTCYSGAALATNSEATEKFFEAVRAIGDAISIDQEHLHKHLDAMAVAFASVVYHAGLLGNFTSGSMLALKDAVMGDMESPAAFMTDQLETAMRFVMDSVTSQYNDPEDEVQKALPVVSLADLSLQSAKEILAQFKENAEAED